MQAPTEGVIGYRVYSGTVGQLANEVVDGLSTPSERRRWVACINPHSYAVARSNQPFRAALRAADWLIPDGSGIVLASRMLGGQIRERVTGPDMFEAVSRELDCRGAFSAMFVGSTESTLAEIKRRYENDFPNATRLATYSPPFRTVFSAADVREIRDRINSVAPDLLWMGLTAPKQELLMHELCTDIDFGFGAAIGAAFDFYAGNIRRSPAFFRDHHMEWLPRLLNEPVRLWRRTCISAPIFLWDLARYGSSDRPDAGAAT